MFTASDGKLKQSGVLVEFSELALHFEMNKDPSEADLQDIQNYLYKRSVAREMAELENLKGLFNAFRKVSFLAGNMPNEKEETKNFEVCIITRFFFENQRAHKILCQFYLNIIFMIFLGASRKQEWSYTQRINGKKWQIEAVP